MKSVDMLGRALMKMQERVGLVRGGESKRPRRTGRGDTEELELRKKVQCREIAWIQRDVSVGFTP